MEGEGTERDGASDLLHGVQKLLCGSRADRKGLGEGSGPGRKNVRGNDQSPFHELSGC